jgi:hypothetical protein
MARMRHGPGLGALLAVILGAASIAAATPADDAARIDWARGLVIAGGVGIADRHAPSPAVARGTSRRGAEQAARTAIVAALPPLPLAGGGTLADRFADPAIKARVDAAVAQAITLDAEPETDGAWHVVLAVPIEAVRVALDGVRAWPAAGDAGAAVIVVDGAASAVPALGWSVRVGGASLPAAIVFARALPASAKGAPHVKAISAKAGVLELPASPAASSASAATLFVVQTK